MSKQRPYVYSLDGDRYREHEPGVGWETREEALAAGREMAGTLAALKEGDAQPASVWTAVKVYYDAIAFLPPPESLVEYMHDLAIEEVADDLVEEWPDIELVNADAPEGSAARELSDFYNATIVPFFEQWVAKHGLEPTFWSVADVCKHADDDAIAVS